MASRQLSSGPENGPDRPSKPRGKRSERKTAKDSAGYAYGVPVPEGLHQAIEDERDNLAKAESVLGCLVVSMEYETDPVDGPYYPDVARIAREMVRQSISRLDPLALQKRLLRDRIKEAPCEFPYLQAAQAAAPWVIEMFS
jgi:hypothetical protein